MAKQLKLPFSLILLNGIGGILLGLGLADMFGNIQIVPEALRINNYQTIMIVIGILLELPFILFIIKHAMGKGPREV